MDTGTTRGAARRHRWKWGLVAGAAILPIVGFGVTVPKPMRAGPSSLTEIAPRDAVADAEIGNGVRATVENNEMILTLAYPADAFKRGIRVYVAVLDGAHSDPVHAQDISDLFDFRDAHWRMPLGKLRHVNGGDAYVADNRRVGFVAGVGDGSRPEDKQWEDAFPRWSAGRVRYTVMKLR